MKSNEKEIAKEILLSEIGCLILRDVNLRIEVRSHVRKLNQTLINRLSKDEYQSFLSCKNTITTLADKLLACKDAEMVTRVLAFIQRLNAGEIYEAVEGVPTIVE
ncbi:hypothetical protein [Dyadobacter sp. CY312]|uniref:hypothetical protein n=1 Tax=Dyadobacter sp. CY312 TaxID=2907303 RepID=UPI001F31908F|nr:hypothetical protein [Dyadobacter sp. CY312]MCE7039220.1 hypothetical protein [Dyadobacter sp. CY312]